MSITLTQFLSVYIPLCMLGAIIEMARITKARDSRTAGVEYLANLVVFLIIATIYPIWFLRLLWSAMTDSFMLYRFYVHINLLQWHFIPYAETVRNNDTLYQQNFTWLCFTFHTFKRKVC